MKKILAPLSVGVALGMAALAMPAVAETVAEKPVAESSAPTTRVMGTALRVSDLQRSKRYYSEGLGMTLATTLVHGSVTEAIFSFGSAQSGQPVLLLLNDTAKTKAEPIANGYGRVMLRTSDVEALAARLRAAGYPVGAIKNNPEHRMKVLMVQDPDGYEFEIVEQGMAQQ